jgi:transcriptional regulator with XRE-family HTH domain
MDGDPFLLVTPREVATTLAARLRALRLERRWKRETLAARAGVSAASLKRFENTGEVSLANLLKLATALDRLDDFDILRSPPATSIEELERRESRRPPQRGTI